MKIFVTGATGFIGSHFVRQALDAGHTVLALRRSEKSQSRIALEREPLWLDRKLDEVTVEDLQGCDSLVHLAAHTGNVPYDSLANCLRWNLTAVVSLFENARLSGISRYVVAGSCFEYGRSGERYTAIPTSAPLEPTNSYAASKAAASIALLQWAQEHQLNLDLLRIFHVFGDGEKESRFWPSLRKAALNGEDFPMTDGEQIRDFAPVDDVAKLFLHHCVGMDDSGNVRVFNVSSGKPQTIKEFADHWWREWEAKGQLKLGCIPYRKGEIMRYIPGEPTVCTKIIDG